MAVLSWPIAGGKTQVKTPLSLLVTLWPPSMASSPRGALLGGRFRGVGAWVRWWCRGVRSGVLWGQAVVAGVPFLLMSFFLFFSLLFFMGHLLGEISVFANKLQPPLLWEPPPIFMIVCYLPCVSLLLFRERVRVAGVGRVIIGASMTVLVIFTSHLSRSGGHARMEFAGQRLVAVESAFTPFVLVDFFDPLNACFIIKLRLFVVFVVARCLASLSLIPFLCLVMTNGLGGHSYLFEPLWWIGLSMMIVGEIANFVAYAFAPAVLVTPLGAMSIIVSAVLAHLVLNERLNKLGFMGCLMCIVGSVVIVIHAPQEHSISSVQEIWNMATQMSFLMYVGSVLVLVFILLLYFAPLCGHSNVLIFTGICSLMGSLSVMCVKALGISLKLTLEGNNQLFYPETWLFAVVLMTCVLTQMNYLNKALDTFNTVVVSPIYYVMFTTLTILASVIMFKDWDGQDGGAIVSEICGFIVIISGTTLLQMTKDIMEKLPSFKGGAYAPMSPTLSAGLCSGNGEFPRSPWDDVENPTEILLKRQESFH